ncbi:hypothetical protein HYE68_008669 [Fusarium pseudograminearum]|nr:hypothetical protein HYE68_008669 [Fusarium pseudograminearum]
MEDPESIHIVANDDSGDGNLAEYDTPTLLLLSHLSLTLLLSSPLSLRPTLLSLQPSQDYKLHGLPWPPGRPPFQDEEEGGLWSPLKTLFPSCRRSPPPA